MKISTPTQQPSFKPLAAKDANTQPSESTPPTDTVDRSTLGSFLQGAAPGYGAYKFLKAEHTAAVEGKRSHGNIGAAIFNIGGTAALCHGHFGVAAAALLISGVVGAAKGIGDK